jgi:hypothetical protein
MRLSLVFVFCIISAALGAGIDHYSGDLASLLRSKPEAAQPRPASSSTSAVEVLGDRVRCDVRFGELHLPDSEYRSFFDHCMGEETGAEKATQ